MEKFSAYRDPGTGIQPFLTPVTTSGRDVLATLLLPLRYALGLVRTAVVIALTLFYLLMVEGVCSVFLPIPSIHRFITYVFTAIIGQAVFFTLGFFWIQTEQVTRKRGRSRKSDEVWHPRAGDIIVSNWASWVEVLWLAIRFNPIFVLPISDTSKLSVASQSTTPITKTPGRRTGTGSAAIQSSNRTANPRVPVLGFREVSLLSMVRQTGPVPPFGPLSLGSYQPLEDIRKKADRPVVVFPECTTSNGRGILRFANVFQKNIPITSHQVFVMCVRYDPPTTFVPTLTHSIPTTSLNPLYHVFKLATSLTVPSVSIRLLAPSEGPSSALFIASDVISGTPGEDQLGESCAVLISQIGKIKRTGMGWEDKASFLNFYRKKY